MANCKMSAAQSPKPSNDIARTNNSMLLLKKDKLRKIIAIIEGLEHDWMIQKLDCRMSALRQGCDKTLDELMDIFETAKCRFFTATLQSKVYWGRPDFYEVWFSAVKDGIEYHAIADIQIKDFNSELKEYIEA